MKTHRFALRILQNRAGLVPRPSWCTYRVRGDQEMDLSAIRRAFLGMGELDLVRFVGPEPLLRPDLPEVLETVLEVSRPTILQLSTEGLAPEAAEDLARGFSEARRLRFLVHCPALPSREAPFSEQRRFGLAIETLERLRPAARERGFMVAAHHFAPWDVEPEAVARLRAALLELGVELFVELPPLPPGASPPALAVRDGLLAEEAAGIADRGVGALARLGHRYYLEGTQQRLLGEWAPRPKCTALRSHVRLEPDGSVPTCAFRPETVGRLTEDFESTWFGAAADEARAVVDRCPGCWSAEEVLPSALYGGDIVRAVRDRAARPLARRPA